ncbi:MAG: DUF6754 domain-containing protein [Candidatus Brocadiia bacterium]
MRRILACATTLVLLVGIGGLCWAETAESPVPKVSLLKNASFEEPRTAVDETAIFPFGWHIVKSGLSAEDANRGNVTLSSRDENGARRNGIKVSCTNPNPIFTNAAYAVFPSPETIKALTGKTITVRANVNVVRANGAKTVPAITPLTGVLELKAGTDFTPEEELQNFRGFAGVNLVFWSSKDLSDDKIVPSKLFIASMAKTRTVAFSTTTGSVSLSCSALVPDGANMAAILLEGKGDMEAVFESVSLDLTENIPGKVMLPFNLGMEILTPAVSTVPKDWFVGAVGQRSYCKPTVANPNAGSYSLELGNPDPNDTGELRAFTCDFDIPTNRALWGKEVTFSARVMTDLAPAFIREPLNPFFMGNRSFIRGKDYTDPIDLTWLRNYAVLKIVCRKAGGKVLEPEICEQEYAFGRSSGWVNIMTKIVVPVRTFSVEWHVVLKGYGRAWFDSVSANITGGANFPLPNEGFEEQYLLPPADWDFTGTTGSVAVLDASEKIDGRHSVCIENANYSQNKLETLSLTVARAAEGLDFPAGWKLVFEADVKAEFNKNDFQQSATIEISASAPSDVFVTPTEAWPKSSAVCGRTEWRRLKAAMIIQDGITDFSFNLNVTGVGKVYFDNLSVTTERVAVPTTAIKNAGFVLANDFAFSDWDLSGPKEGSRAIAFPFANPPVYGDVADEGARIWQDLTLEGDLSPKNLAGKPVSFYVLGKCESSLTMKAQLRFYGEGSKEIEVPADGTSIVGVSAAEFLFAPFRLAKVSAAIPSGCRKIVAELAFAGTSGRYQVLKVKISGNPPITDRSVLGLAEGLPEYSYEVAEFDYVAPKLDDVLSFQGPAGDFLAKYGRSLTVIPSVPGGALLNGAFASAERYVPDDFKYYHLSAKAVVERAFAYTVLPLGSGTALSQRIDFPEDVWKKIVGETFTFWMDGGVINAEGALALQFIGKDGTPIGEAVEQTFKKAGSISGGMYAPASSSTSAKIPEGTTGVILKIIGRGDGGKLILCTAGVGSLFVGTGLFDWLAYYMWFDFAKTNVLVGVLLFSFLIMFFIFTARRRDLFVRKIAGLDSIDEAIGRATEMGKPILYLPGLDTIDYLSTIAAVNILSRVAKRIADYEAPLRVPNYDPVVMAVCQETVKSAYMHAGRPDAYDEDSVFYLSSDQFAYVSAVIGLMSREKPAANFFMGGYYAEALMLAEAGATTGAIQIAGTDSVHQLPFFIVACDYTLMGEELYAASAYLSREPMELGSLKGSDYSKMIFMLMVVFGTVAVTINTGFMRWLVELINVQ